LKSYNNRYLDIAVNLPPFLSPLEPAVRSYLKEHVQRGRVELSVRVKELEEDIKVHLDTAAAMEYGEALKRLCETLHLEEEPKLSHLLSVEGIFKAVKERNLEWFEQLLMKELEEAGKEFEETRRREGEDMRRDIEKNIHLLRGLAGTIEKHADRMEAQLREDMASRLREIVGENYDENRILSETAVLLMKYSIGEETVRMNSHLDHFEQNLGLADPVGKKLDFICQELNREINTIGSKSSIVEINHAVVQGKDALEKIREQLRNVE
jgi:uncharacterized protein (TIGR00255 family)